MLLGAFFFPAPKSLICFDFITVAFLALTLGPTNKHATIKNNDNFNFIPIILT